MSSSNLALGAATRLPRGIHFEWYHGHKVHFAVDSKGQRLPFLGVPIGDETEDDVIARLADSLDGAEPQPCPDWASIWAGVGTRSSRPSRLGRVLSFRR
jgi:hypothetical protein